MRSIEKRKIDVKVLKVGLKEWINDENLSMYKALQEMGCDPEMYPLDQIAEQKDVYQIIYTAEHPKENFGDQIFVVFSQFNQKKKS